jgi:hypothetical protein
MAFTYPTLDTTEKLQKFINGDPQLTGGFSSFQRLPSRGRYTKFLGGEFSQISYNILRISGPRVVLNSLEGIRFPERVLNHGETKLLQINHTPINRLDNAVFPNLLELVIIGNQITSLNGVRFPETLRYLTIENEQIQSLVGVHFPSNLVELNITGSRITSLKGVTFPVHVSSINLSNNQIASFDGMKFPLSLESLHLEHNNPTIIDTIRLLKYPTEVVMREIIRGYPATAEYFDSQRELKEFDMQKLQNHMLSIAKFLQPLILERKTIEEANLTEGNPRLFVRDTMNNADYLIPFDSTKTVQSAIDYLEQNYLLSVTNGYVKINLINSSNNNILDPSKIFAHENIQNENTLIIVQDNSRQPPQEGGRKQTKHNKLKMKRYKSRKCKRPFRLPIH